MTEDRDRAIHGARILIFALACAGLAPAILRVAGHMPRFGAHPLPYGDAINRAAPIERHVTNMISAVNFDYRGFDTLGEEFMLLCAVTGTVVLLRGTRGEGVAEQPGQVEGCSLLPRSEATLLISRLIAPVIVLFGIYMAIHPTVTPGGGFQGGVIIATGLLMIFLGQDYVTWQRLIKTPMLDMAEGGGALLYGLCGFASIVAGAPFLTNFLPLGQIRSIFSGGLMLVENLGVAFAVTGGFTVLFQEFLEETRVEKPRDQP